VGLFSRSSDVTVTVSPAVAKLRSTVTASASVARPGGKIAKVTSATLDWGYTNFFNYHWAGRVDSAAAAGNDTVWTMGQVGTHYGGDRDTGEWVSVTKVELPIATGEFSGGTSTFRVPSWAPASSKEIAAWSCRLVVVRGGRDIDTRGEFAVRIGHDDVSAELDPMERVMGDAETVIDIDLPTAVFGAGETIRGQVTLTPMVDLPDGDLAVTWQRRRESHPLTRTPGPGGALDGRIITLGTGIPLRAGAPITLPFEIPIPPDAPPTASAVHSSMDWFVQARLFYAGFSTHMTERVVRPIVVVSGSEA
jgi:hypothetical protein